MKDILDKLHSLLCNEIDDQTRGLTEIVRALALRVEELENQQKLVIRPARDLPENDRLVVEYESYPYE